MSLQNESVSKTENRKKYDRFKKAGIKYIDYKDGNFLLKLLN
jgi:small subunit ribosomal protein S18